MNKQQLKQSLINFLNEDIQTGDVTSEAIFTDNERGVGQFIVKETGIICGLFLIKEIYELLSLDVKIILKKAEGDAVIAGDIVAQVHGPIQTLLTGERLILNLMQRLSGIATLTKQAVETLDDETIRICDTRKTTPGLRTLEKYAVRTGGGYNHRFGLYDGVMIKDNHISFCGSITEAVKRVRTKTSHMIKIEVETESKIQVEEAVNAGADIIMFDNQPAEVVQDWVKIVPPNITTEASGGITLDNLKSYKSSGVDCLSLGFLTHSATALDISFLEQIT